MGQQHQFPRLAMLTSIVLAASLGGALRGSEPVQVRLQGGRILNGELDPRTDDDALWLRFRYSSVLLSSAYAWSRVETVQIGQDRMSSDEFRRVSQGLKPAAFEDVGNDVGSVVTEQNRIVLPKRSRPANGVAKITSLWASARLANWDRDAEMDGLEVCIVPRNSRDELVLAQGRLKITLVARSRRSRLDQDAFPELGRWSFKVQAGDFHDGCAVYRAAFRRKNPLRDFSIRPEGLVQLQLNATGQGAFAAETPVLLRIHNPVREELQKRRS